MTRSTVHPYSRSTLTIQSSLAGGLRGFCAKWRVRRKCEARALELETVLREMDPRLARDIGFDLVASRRGDDGQGNGHALIQAVSIAFGEEPTDGA